MTVEERDQVLITSLLPDFWASRILGSKRTEHIPGYYITEKILKLDHDKRHEHGHKHSKDSVSKDSSKKPKKVVKSSVIKKKIRKK